MILGIPTAVTEAPNVVEESRDREPRALETGGGTYLPAYHLLLSGVTAVSLLWV